MASSLQIAAQILEHKLDKLPPGQQEILRAIQVCQSDSVAEVAHYMHKPDATVKIGCLRIMYAAYKDRFGPLSPDITEWQWKEMERHDEILDD